MLIDPDYVPLSAQGERCTVCGAPAARKVCEQVFDDDPMPNRHEFTAYVCLKHFNTIMGIHVD